MKPLLPTLKEKKRYIAYEIQTSKPIPARALLERLKAILGIFGSAEAGLQSISHNKNKGVVRTSLQAYPRVRAALTMISHIQDQHARITVTNVSGILNKNTE